MSRLLIKNVYTLPAHSEFTCVAEQAARAGGRVLLEMLGRARVYEKGPRDLVTEADRTAQSVIHHILTNAFPNHQFVGEEDALPTNLSERRDSGALRWIVDPLDGTANYVHALPGFAVSIALEQNGQVLAAAVFDPILDECYLATAGAGAFLNGEKIQVSRCDQIGEAMAAASFPANVERTSPEIASFEEMLVSCHSLRRFGSAALNLCYLACGRMDAYWSTSVKPWDVAAGWLLVTEAGGVMTAVDGSPFDLYRPRFAASANANLHQQLVGIVGREKA